jgi:hypothetical protein
MPKRFELTDILKAKMMPELMRRLRMRQQFESPVDGEARLAIQQFARETLPLTRAKGLKLTATEWAERLLFIIRTRHPETRDKLLAALKSRYVSK